MKSLMLEKCVFAPLSDMLFGESPSRASIKNSNRDLSIYPKSGELEKL